MMDAGVYVTCTCIQGVRGQKHREQGCKGEVRGEGGDTREGERGRGWTAHLYDLVPIVQHFHVYLYILVSSLVASTKVALLKCQVYVMALVI